MVWATSMVRTRDWGSWPKALAERPATAAVRTARFVSFIWVFLCICQTGSLWYCIADCALVHGGCGRGYLAGELSLRQSNRFVTVAAQKRRTVRRGPPSR